MQDTDIAMVRDVTEMLAEQAGACARATLNRLGTDLSALTPVQAPPRVGTENRLLTTIEASASEPDDPHGISPVLTALASRLPPLSQATSPQS